MTGYAQKFDELADSGAKQIDLVINSPGGEVFAGLDLLKHLETTKAIHGIHVTCTVDMMAASMGFVILQDSVCDARLATRRSIFLGHNSSGEYSGKASEVRKKLLESDTVDNAIAEIAGARLNIGVARLQGQDCR